MNGIRRKILVGVGAAAAAAGLVVVTALPASAAPDKARIQRPGSGLDACASESICFWASKNFVDQLDPDDDSEAFDSAAVIDPGTDQSDDDTNLPDFGKLQSAGLIPTGDLGMQDATSSVANKTFEPWCIFTDNNFQGLSMQVEPNTGLKELPAQFDNQVSSAKRGACPA